MRGSTGGIFCCLTDVSVLVLQHVLHLQGMHPRAGVEAARDGPSALDMGHRLGEPCWCCRQGSLGGKQCTLQEGYSCSPRQDAPRPVGVVLVDRQMQSRQCVCAAWVCCMFFLPVGRGSALDLYHVLLCSTDGPIGWRS